MNDIGLKITDTSVGFMGQKVLIALKQRIKLISALLDMHVFLFALQN